MGFKPFSIPMNTAKSVFSQGDFSYCSPGSISSIAILNLTLYNSPYTSIFMMIAAPGKVSNKQKTQMF